MAQQRKGGRTSAISRAEHSPAAPWLGAGSESLRETTGREDTNGDRRLSALTLLPCVWRQRIPNESEFFYDFLEIFCSYDVLLYIFDHRWRNGCQLVIADKNAQVLAIRSRLPSWRWLLPKPDGGRREGAELSCIAVKVAWRFTLTNGILKYVKWQYSMVGSNIKRKGIYARKWIGRKRHLIIMKKNIRYILLNM